MIIKKFNINDLKLNYFIGINQIKLIDKKFALNQIFDLIENMQTSYDGSIIQFFNDKYVLSQDHVFLACYYVQKAFLQNINISNKKNIELFLYLATKRQIKISIEAFGITENSLKTGKLNFCIISPKNIIAELNIALLKHLGGIEIKFTLNNKTIEKFNRIKNFFNISDNQIITILNSYGISNINNFQINENLNILFSSLDDLICEKMTILSLEKIKIN